MGRGGYLDFSILYELPSFARTSHCPKPFRSQKTPHRRNVVSRNTEGNREWWEMGVRAKRRISKEIPQLSFPVLFYLRGSKCYRDWTLQLEF